MFYHTFYTLYTLCIDKDKMPFPDNQVLEMLLQSVVIIILHVVIYSHVFYLSIFLKNKYEGTISKETFIKHLKTPPNYTIVRVNQLTTSKQNLKEEIKVDLMKVNKLLCVFFVVVLETTISLNFLAIFSKGNSLSNYSIP